MDHTSDSTVLEYRAEFPAPKARVFAALTEARHLEHWFCDSAESDARPGGRIVMRWTGHDASVEPFEARWDVVEPETSCAYQGGHAGYPDGDAGRVGFELSSREGGVTVLVTRHRLPPVARLPKVVARYRAPGQARSSGSPAT